MSCHIAWLGKCKLTWQEKGFSLRTLSHGTKIHTTVGNREVFLQQKPLNTIRKTSYANLDKVWPATTCRTHSVSTFGPEPRGASNALGARWNVIGRLKYYSGLSWLEFRNLSWCMAHGKMDVRIATKVPLSHGFITSFHSYLLPPCYCSLTVCLEDALLYQGFTGTAHLHLASTAQGHPNWGVFSRGAPFSLLNAADLISCPASLYNMEL